MNNKQAILNKIVDIVVSCCVSEVNGKMSFTRDDVLGKSRAENLVMTRCILSHMMLNTGYSITTTALLLGRSTQAVRHLIDKGYDYMKTSRAYRMANAEATLLCRDIEA